MSALLPERRPRHRSGRDEITVETIAVRLYLRNPDKSLDSAPVPHLPHWTAARSYNSPKWRLAVAQARDIYAMFQPFEPVHEYRSRMMYERLVRSGITEHSWEDIDRAIVDAVSEAENKAEAGRLTNLDNDQTWSEIEGIVLLDLDINEGLYWAADIG